MSSNVFHLTFPSRQDSRAARCAALVATFASHRRTGDDVFWLKENAELLNILECTGQTLPENALDPLAEFYDDIERRMGFFPQYYRFFLSICLDLEALGMPGDKGERLVNWACDAGLAEMELSDLQRAEARRLMQRRGRDPLSADATLDDRLRAFVARPGTFAMPNKKAAYELTHTVFYLSEYGRRDPKLPSGSEESLNFCGTLAYLEANADLLAEICTAMHYAGINPSGIWVEWLERETARIRTEQGQGAMARDAYHEYLVSNWALSAVGRDAFRGAVPEGTVAFSADHAPGPLRDLSETLFDLNTTDRGDWVRMRDYLLGSLDADGAATLAEAESACTDFERFFDGFARTGLARATAREIAGVRRGHA